MENHRKARPPADGPAPQLAEVPRPDLFRLLVERVKDYAIFALDPRGIVVSWNSGAERIKGYKATEIIGHHFSRFYPEEAIRSGWPQTELEFATREGRFEDEGWRIRKDGSRFWANVVITALHDDDGTLRGFAKVTRDMTEHKRVERLEADARQMSEFVAMLAHELRNPLAPIRNAVQLAQHRLDDPERMSWALGIIERQARQLTRLVDDLLDISRITRGTVRLERRRLHLREPLERAIEAVRPACEKKRHALEVELGPDPLVRGDSVRLTQVLTNIIGNACKYTPEGGRVEVTLEADEQCARIRVRDTGIGISPELLPRIFDIFTQEQRSLERADGGLGLGLSIAKRLVDMHGGTLAASSAGPGCGSEFAITLPLAGLAEEGQAADTRVCVLVVDDNTDSAQSMQALLELAGFRCLVAYDGRTGLELAQQHSPDVVLLDIGLPGMNGYEVARSIRHDSRLQGVVLVAVTGYGSEDDIRRALEAGFDHHVAKPVEFEELLRRVPALAAAQDG